VSSGKQSIHESYTEYWTVDATGHRIGLVTCRVCGATVIVGDPEKNWADVHGAWHEKWRPSE
jgi:hypothetical protein